MVEEIATDFEVRAAVLKETRDLVYNINNCSNHVESAINGVAAGDHAAILWPLLCGMAKAKYHLLLCEPMNGEEAERCGLVSLCVEDEDVQDKALEVAVRLASGSTTAVRWTKYTLNNWLRVAGPVFDASVAMEFVGFGGPDVSEGIAAIREKRPPSF